MLELADELVSARLVLHRLAALEAEISHDREVVARAPELVASISDRRAGIEEVARDLEAQWVDQGPLVSLWQRAVELAELAEGSGADGTEYRADVDEARRRVETARLVTRDTLDRLCSQREALVDVLLAAPFDLPTPAPVRDDGRPEAGRRDALALIEAADAALEVTKEQEQRAAGELERAAREHAQLGDEAEVASRIADIQRDLPEIIELPSSAPPSAAIRLQRAGLRVTVDAPA